MGPASATIRLLHSFLKQASVSAWVSRSFNFWKDFSWGTPNEMLVLSRKDSEQFGNLVVIWQELAQYYTCPEKDLNSAVFCGGLAFCIAGTFSSVGEIACLLKSNPENVNLEV